MGIEVIVSLFSGILSLAFGGVFTSEVARNLIQVLVKHLGSKNTQQPESYSDKLTRLTNSLTTSSAEVDNVLAELAKTAQDREKAAQQLQIELSKLEVQEKELQQRIRDLENVPIPVAEHFAKLTAAGEKKSAFRDYMLFGTGVIVSTIIAIMLKYFGFGVVSPIICTTVNVSFV